MKTARISFLVSFLALSACAHAQESGKDDAPPRRERPGTCPTSTAWP
jgi:hypothetical protein